MAMSLYQPPVGSTGWGLQVDQNFQTLQDFCNNVANALLDAVPVMTPPSPGDGVKGLVPAPGSGDSPNFLAGDGEWREAGGPWGVVPVMVGDSGSGGAAGLVPAQVAGDAVKFLRGDASWSAGVVYSLVYGGTAALTDGTVTVNCSHVTNSSVILVGYSAGPPTDTVLWCGNIVPGVSFDIHQHSGSDTGAGVWWMLFEAYNP